VSGSEGEKGGERRRKKRRRISSSFSFSISCPATCHFGRGEGKKNEIFSYYPSKGRGGPNWKKGLFNRRGKEWRLPVPPAMGGGGGRVFFRRRPRERKGAIYSEIVTLSPLISKRRRSGGLGLFVVFRGKRKNGRNWDTCLHSSGSFSPTKGIVFILPFFSFSFSRISLLCGVGKGEKKRGRKRLRWNGVVWVPLSNFFIFSLNYSSIAARQEGKGGGEGRKGRGGEKACSLLYPIPFILYFYLLSSSPCTIRGEEGEGGGEGKGKKKGKGRGGGGSSCTPRHYHSRFVVLLGYFVEGKEIAARGEEKRRKKKKKEDVTKEKKKAPPPSFEFSFARGSGKRKGKGEGGGDVEVLPF